MWRLMRGLVTVIISFESVPFFNPQGFYCDDVTISHKFTGDTVPPSHLFLYSFGYPVLIIILRVWFNSQSAVLDSILKWSWAKYKSYLFGLLGLMSFVSVVKQLVGEPRPHFLDTCQPFEAINCSQGYISAFECSNRNVSLLRIVDSNRSFPSGHSAMATYLLVFVWTFMGNDRSFKNKPVIWTTKMCTLVMSSTCALSRIVDYRHHWWDVLGGSVFGLIAFAATQKCGENDMKNVC